ncbi:MAG: hypothetical protein WD010_08810 [Nitriliruptor sp.]|uniref:hypothetical protein n=1 Tax=Nitriliruptor sp. TaxID=2448056 RepID=UPI0034A00F4A
MPTRTYLTTPPGREPSEATGRSASEDVERYVSGPTEPVEPKVASRWRGPLLVVVTAALLVAILVTILRVSAASQAQDPSLDAGLDATPADEGPTLRDTIPAPGGAPQDEGLPGES